LTAVKSATEDDEIIAFG